jgi:DNA polymerase-1
LGQRLNGVDEVDPAMIDELLPAASELSEAAIRLAGVTEAQKLLLLDGHSLAYRAFFALPVENFQTTMGIPTNAVYGFTSMLINQLRDEQPTHVGVAFDVSRRTFRNEAYADYKAGRSESPTDFKGQVSLIKEVLAALRIPSFGVEGFEADDVIATLATQAREQGMEVLIGTGDRDALQLVDEHTTVLYPRRGVSELVRFTPEEVQERYGLTPAQYPDFAALRGDPSDNLPNMPGVGEKTAAKWIRDFGSLTALIERVDEVKGKAGDTLRAHVSSVLRNRQLTELVRDVDVPVTPEDLKLGQWDRDEVNKLFDTLQFRVLRERLFQTLTAPEPEAESGFDITGTELGADEVPAWLDEHARSGRRVGVGINGSWGRGTGVVSGIALAVEGGEPDDAAYIDAEALTDVDERALVEWLTDASVAKAAHDLKGLLLALHARGWDLAGVTSDTALAAYLALPGQRTFDLSDLVLRYLQRELRADDDVPADGQLTLDGGEEEADAAVARDQAVRARAIADLARALDDDLDTRGATRLLRELELPLTTVIAGMEQTGIGADLDYLVGLQAEFAAQVKAVEQEAYASVGREFNLGSPKQLQAILFDELKLPKTKRIKSGYTTDADALFWLSEQAPDVPLLGALLRHRDVSRLKTVVDSLIPMVDDHGRIHTTFNQVIAATGRLSSQDPNLQNIPIRTAEGRRIRRAFVVGEGFESLLTADYSQIEMRIMATLSEDAGLIEAFTSGEDLHTFVASRAFSLPPEQVDPELRRRIKAMSYGLAYGLSAYGLAQQLRIHPDEAREQMNAYFERFGGVRDYLRNIVDRARMDGYTETIMGRRRYLPDLTSDNRQRREMAERMALNAPIQGSAADIIKVAMLGVDRGLKAAGLRSRLLLQVHDELVLEVAPGEREAVEELVRAEMGGAYSLAVPLDVSVGAGRTWDDAGH